jgi:hypothetical protein
LKSELALLIDGDQGGPDGVRTHLAELEKTWIVSARVCIRNWRSTKDMAAWEAAARDCSLECIQHSPESRGKNATDIELAIRAMDLFHGSGYRAFCVLSADSDFVPLKRRLERAGGHVILRPLVLDSVATSPKPTPSQAPTKQVQKVVPPTPKSPAPKTGDAVAFGRVLDRAYDECIAKGRHLDQAVTLLDIGERIPKGSKPDAFGYAKSWPLHRVVATIATYAVAKDAKGRHVVTRL